MGDHVRVRCPVCGMLVWQKRLDKDYPFEFVIQTIKSGVGGLRHSYRKSFAAATKSSYLFKLFFADKMVEKAKELVRDLPFTVVISMEVPELDEVADQFNEDELEKFEKDVDDVDVDVSEEDSFWHKKGKVTVAEIKELELESDVGIEIPFLAVKDLAYSGVQNLKGMLRGLLKHKKFKSAYIDEMDVDVDVDEIMDVDVDVDEIEMEVET